MDCTIFYLYVDSSSRICMQVGAGWVGKRECWAYFLRSCLSSDCFYVLEVVPYIDLLYLCVHVCVQCAGSARRAKS